MNTNKTLNNRQTTTTTIRKPNRKRHYKKPFIWACAVCGAIAGITAASGVVVGNWNGDVAEQTVVDTETIETADISLVEATESTENIRPFTLCTLPYNGNYGGFKSYESHTAITNEDSDQYTLQKMAWTDTDAFRRVDEYYLVAIGTYFEAPVGRFVDVVLENGTVINCIVGDIKADDHTDTAYHIWSENNCATEFIVDAYATDAKKTGDVSYIYPEWQSRVVSIKVYEDSYLA